MNVDSISVHPRCHLFHVGGWEAFREPPNPSKQLLFVAVDWNRKSLAKVTEYSQREAEGRQNLKGERRGEARPCCCNLVFGDGEGGGSREEEVFEGVADMDSEESQDGHSLRLHPSHHLHRHADRTQASTIAAFEPCLN